VDARDLAVGDGSRHHDQRYPLGDVVVRELDAGHQDRDVRPESPRRSPLRGAKECVEDPDQEEREPGDAVREEEQEDLALGAEVRLLVTRLRHRAERGAESEDR